MLLSQFPIGDQSTFRQTWAEVLSFLMAPVEGLAHPFWECMSAEQALDVVVNATYLDAPPPKPEEEEDDKGEKELVKEVEKGEQLQVQGLPSDGKKGHEGRGEGEKEGEEEEDSGEEEEEEEVAANKASKEARAYAHTTGYRMSAGEKAALLQRLRGDPVLGPVIAAVAAALHATPDPTTSHQQKQGQG